MSDEYRALLRQAEALRWQEAELEDSLLQVRNQLTATALKLNVLHLEDDGEHQ